MLMLQGRQIRLCRNSFVVFMRQGRFLRRCAMRAAAVTALSFAIASCNPEAIICPANLPPPILVEVRDGLTGQPAAQGASGWIKKGNDTSPLYLAGSGDPLVLASDGGAGTYDVVVQKVSYTTWIRSGVFVAGGRCGVQRSVVLKADLQPSG
jgi:hypothetical protein